MQTQVSVIEKKNFIRWFLDNYQLKKRESIWILNYLLNHEEILTYVHFVHDVTLCPRAIIMTSFCSEEVPFRFNKSQVFTTDADKSFHDIRINQTASLYIQLNFKNSHRSSIYAGVLEDNPYLPDRYNITSEDRQLANMFLEKSLHDFNIKKYSNLIDKALDENNMQDFMKWTRKLNHIVNNK